MSILLSRSYVVPTWFVVAGLLALSASPIAAAGVLLLCAVVATTAVIITFALRTRPNALQTAEIQRTWQRPRHNEAALGLDGDAHDLMRMDTDKG